MYSRIDGDQYRHIYIVGDLHGCYDLFQSELAAIEFDPNQDLMLSVGDLVDRGTQSLQCLDLISQPWFKAVRGNHEELMHSALSDPTPDNTYWWEINGGGWDTILNEEERLLLASLTKRIPDLPLIVHLQLGAQVVVVAHADYPINRYEFGLPVDQQLVVWNRQRFGAAKLGLNQWIAGADLFVFGHSILDKPLRHENLLYIDTGPVQSGVLTIARVK